jgi:hypothetical protein
LSQGEVFEGAAGVAYVRDQMETWLFASEAEGAPDNLIEDRQSHSAIQEAKLDVGQKAIQHPARMRFSKQPAQLTGCDHSNQDL